MLSSKRKPGSITKETQIVKSSNPIKHRILISIPMTGLIRSEWAIARYGQVIPCNWSQTDALAWINQFSPLGFAVADARNMAAHQCLEHGFEWLYFIDHDVIIPPHTTVTWNERMIKGEIPVWSGLYFTKSVPSEPLIYRGRGNGYFSKWKFGELVWVDGIPMGCTMIHSSILRVMQKDADWYETSGYKIKKIFDTPAKIVIDPATQSWHAATGTEDLNWCTNVINNDVLKRAGWKKIGSKKHPFLIDTNIFCRHIDFDGTQYPSKGEECQFS